MHYYQHSIGDYRRDTTHLSLLEHGIYRQFLDTYYLSESPLCANHAELMRTHSIRNADEVQAAEFVLKDFFTLTEFGYVHKRCSVEIELYKAKSDSAKASADTRWAKHRESKNNNLAGIKCETDANALRTQSEGNANHKPLTNNHKPIEKQKNSSPDGSQFDLFWSFQLRVVDKKKCRAAWDKRNLDSLADVIIPKARAYNASIEDVKFCKHPLTWLNGECWNDEIKPRQNAPPPPQKSKALQAIEKLQGIKNGMAQNGNQHRVIEADIARLGMGSGDGFDRGNFGGMDGSIDA